MPLRAPLRPFATFALLALAAAPALGCAGNRSAGDPFALVGIPEVERMLSEPEVAVIDANPKDVFQRNHLPGAKHYKSAPFAEVLPAGKTTRLVFYCASPS